MYRYARLTLGDPNDVYDVVQEVFVSALRHWGSYGETSSPKTASAKWL
ncbi:RNA polymerase sigma factor [Alicyclobacillus acidiphilus]